ncbi:MAG: FkbM family methyltransferase [Gemmatimonadales bacterium]
MSGLLRRMLERLPMAEPLVRRAAEWQVRRAVHAAGCEVHIDSRAVDVRRGSQVVRLNPRHLLFAPDVAAHFDAYWTTVESGNDPSLRDFSSPARHFIPALGVHLWQSGLMEEVDTILGYLRHAPPRAGETVFDLGSNCGASVFVFSGAVGPAGKVVAFEPDPLNRELLKRNVESLALRNVAVRGDAVAGRSGRLRFNSEGSLGAALSHVVSRAGLAETIEVQALTLADACAAAGCAPDFIKMDVEGAEEEVIEGARGWLGEHRPRWVIDTHHRIDGTFTDVAVERSLRASGYRAWTELVGGFRTTFAVPEDAAT